MCGMTKLIILLAVRTPVPYRQLADIIQMIETSARICLYIASKIGTIRLSIEAYIDNSNLLHQSDIAL